MFSHPGVAEEAASANCALSRRAVGVGLERRALKRTGEFIRDIVGSQQAREGDSLESASTPARPKDGSPSRGKVTRDKHPPEARDKFCRFILELVIPISLVK